MWAEMGIQSWAYMGNGEQEDEYSLACIQPGQDWSNCVLNWRVGSQRLFSPQLMVMIKNEQLWSLLSGKIIPAEGLDVL